MEVEGSSEQEVWWSWGAGTEGQLGTEKLQDEHSPQILHSLSSFGPISSISCGGAHVIALTPGGRVITWGRGSSGQLGHREMVNGLKPKVVQCLEGFVITRVSAGWNHSAFVSECGSLFTCGDGSFGQLGHGDYSSRCSPEKVSRFKSLHVEDVACGTRHTLVLVKGGQVHGFGSGKRGQLGVSGDMVKSSSLPQTTMGLDGIKVDRLYANGDHSAALCAEGQVYTWGRGFNGGQDIRIPCGIASELLFSQAALGWNHLLLLTVDGDAFMLGRYGQGILDSSQETTEKEEEPSKYGLQRIHGLDGRKVLQIGAGAEHSAIITADASVLTWGWGEHGQLGLGDVENQTKPREVDTVRTLDKQEQHLLPRVFCGSGFTYVVKTCSSDSTVHRTDHSTITNMPTTTEQITTE